MSTIREGRKEDCAAIADMIKELAEYEKMPQGPEIGCEELEEDGFGEKKYFHTFVAELDQSKELAGYCLFFYKYSTWQGKFLWMEDLYVKPQHRNTGIGTRLWQEVARKAHRESCKRIEFAVLDWNQPSIEFYKKNGAVNLTTTEGWQVFRLQRSEIEKLASKTS